ncbi:hypothetical protein GCM10007940_10270 [Portibacter lacus]|uniref:Uncharacterized protein n=2 Tax=Portibacter lacus TaxID=1099794 RepID=A0AA37SMC0_9BACT|nr:hypothetical protein GCM10007940_10270 [Portibacter lacus]
MTELNETQLANVDRWYFLSDQLLMGFTFSIFTVAGILFFLKNKSYRYLGLTSIFVIGTLLFLRGKSYYTIGMFPILLAGGSVYIEKIVKDWRLRTLFIILPVLLVLPILPLGVPIFKQDGLVNFFQKLEDKHGLIMGRRFEDGSIHSLPQDYADMLGWEELVMKVTIAFNEIPDKSQALIYAENYGQAGAINIIGKKYDLPSVVSFNESFIYWIPNRLENDIRYFIYVNDELGDDIQALFQTIVHIGEVTNIHAREYGTTVYLCSNPRSSFSLFYKEILDQL